MLDTPNYTTEQLNGLRRFFHAMNYVMVFMLRLGLGRMCEWWPEGFGRILIIEHRGRRSGKHYKTPVNYAPINGDVYCLAGFGPRTDWYRNVLADPHVRLWLPKGRRNALASEASDSPQRVHLMRQVIIGSGFAGPLKADPDKTSVPIRFSVMDKEDESPITFHLENATLHLLLQVVAEQAGLTLDIGEEIVSLRRQSGNQAEPGQLVQPAAQEEEDVAFFEKKYQKKITGVKPKGEYADPDQFYSAIAVQLGIPEIAWEAAAKMFGWKKDDGKVTKSMVKGGPTAAGGQGTWDVLFIRFAVNPETKKPDPATMESKMVQLDYDGNIKFPEIPKENR